MALTSPGVEVTIIDQSQYLPAPTGSVPLVVFATAQNKANPTGTGVAQGTTAANANKLFQITSQRDLVTIYGTPFFYTTTNGTPIQGYELNEYGLLAAYSLLGTTNRCYTLRADIDLASLVGQTSRPSGDPTNDSWWLDTATTSWGIFEWNATTQKFVQKNPIIITEDSLMSGGFPKDSIGNIGDYAIYTLPNLVFPSQSSTKTYFVKTIFNQWTSLGSGTWLNNWPTVYCTISNPTLISGTFSINISGQYSITITINPGDTAGDVVTSINNLGYSELKASLDSSGKIQIFSIQSAPNITPAYLSLSSGTAGLLASMGVPSNTSYLFYQPSVYYGTSAQLPLWNLNQSNPAPSGSVWLKVGAAGSGLNTVVSVYNDTTQLWVSKAVTYAPSATKANYTLDPAGGRNIPVNTVWCQNQYFTSSGSIIGLDPSSSSSPVNFYYRTKTGSTVVTGENTSISFTNGPYVFEVSVSNPNSQTMTTYLVYLDDNSDASDFVTAWSAANIQYTTATVGTDGNITITHTLGGEIIINDAVREADFVGSITGTTLTVTSLTTGKIKIGSTIYTAGGGFTYGTTITAQVSGNAGEAGTYTVSASQTVTSTTMTAYPSDFGQSAGITAEIGLTPNVTSGVIYGPASFSTYVADGTLVIPGVGTGAIFEVLSTYGYYTITPTPLQAGTGYVVGNTILIDGSDLGGVSGDNDLTLIVISVDGGGGITAVSYIDGVGLANSTIELSNWKQMDYTPNELAPVSLPRNNTNWYYSVVDEVDILINYNSAWYGYRNRAYDENGQPKSSGTNMTDPFGPIVSASEPTTQSDGTALQYGDLWINTGDLEAYPVISRWQAVDGEDKWVLIDNTDQVNPTGVVFADARWGANGGIDPVNDAIPTIASMLTSNYIDLDAPEPSLYPTGMLLFNTRRSGNNVKQFRTNVFTQNNYPEAGAYNPLAPTNINNLPLYSYTWVSTSGLQSNGAPYMGRKAQRAMVVKALKSAIDTNTDIRDEDNFFNLMATPNYPELQPNMVVLNTDRGETGYILGDTPLGLKESATDIQAWANNTAGASSTGEEGCVTRNTYLGLFYPSGITNDLNGNEVVVPASHMMLRTFLRNDTVAYPWLAAAGTRRGIIDNANNIGYLDRDTGEFVAIKTRLGIRDTLYTNFINPLVFFTGNGLLNYGNKTSFNSSSALDRTNVARLVAFIRRQLTLAARPFVFEPNDALTRKQIAGVVETLMIDLVAKRGIYDYLVICDESNNTPARIDRNELWVDVAVEPVKAAEFIYIPVRILNTGEIQGA